MNARTRGVTVTELDRDRLAATWNARPGKVGGVTAADMVPSAIMYDRDGAVQTINHEGVRDDGRTDDLFAVYAAAGGWFNFDAAELIAAATGDVVDLADYVRTFGDRLERNYGLAYFAATGRSAWGA